MLLFFLLPFLLCMIGCDAEKNKLIGEREDIVPTSILKPDEKAKREPIRLYAPVKRNTSWSLQELYTSNIIHPELQFPLSRAWEKEGIASPLSLIPNSFAIPSIVSDKIYALTLRGEVLALNSRTGNVLFEKPLYSHDVEIMGGGVYAQDGFLYVATSLGDVIKMKASSGKILWKKNLSAPVRCSPSADKNTVYVITTQNKTVALDILTGQVRWVHEGLSEATSLYGSASPIAEGNFVYSAYSSGEIVALSKNSGVPLWSDTIASSVGTESFAMLPHIKATPVLSNGVLFVVSHGGKFSAYDSKTGAVVWQKEIGGQNSPVVSGNAVFLLTNDQELVALDIKTGDIRAVAPLQKLNDDEAVIHWSGPVLAGGHLVLINNSRDVFIYDPISMKQTQHLVLSTGAYIPPCVANNQLHVFCNDGAILVFRKKES